MGYVEKKRTAFLGLPLYFTKYTIEESVLNIRRGFFKIIEDDVFMYKIQDVRLSRTLIERMFRLGTVKCYSSDVTESQLELKHIKNSREVKDFIMQTSEDERNKRRTLRTMELDYDANDDAN